MSVFMKGDHALVVIYCGECKEKISIKVPYEKRDTATRFPFEFVYVHGEPQHGLTLYLDAQMQVRGSEILRNIDIKMDTPKILEMRQVPVKTGNISPMARSLGMISQKEFDILELIDGKITVYDISQKKGINLQNIDKIIKKLIGKSLIKITEI